MYPLSRSRCVPGWSIVTSIVALLGLLEDWVSHFAGACFSAPSISMPAQVKRVKCVCCQRFVPSTGTTRTRKGAPRSTSAGASSSIAVVARSTRSANRASSAPDRRALPTKELSPSEVAWSEASASRRSATSSVVAGSSVRRSSSWTIPNRVVGELNPYCSKSIRAGMSLANIELSTTNGENIARTPIATPMHAVRMSRRRSPETIAPLAPRSAPHSLQGCASRPGAMIWRQALQRLWPASTPDHARAAIMKPPNPTPYPIRVMTTRSGDGSAPLRAHSIASMKTDIMMPNPRIAPISRFHTGCDGSMTDMNARSRSVLIVDTMPRVGDLRAMSAVACTAPPISPRTPASQVSRSASRSSRVSPCLHGRSASGSKQRGQTAPPLRQISGTAPRSRRA